MDRRRGAQGPNPCFDFRKGRCKFGARCKYSHDISSSPAGPPQPSASQSRPPTRRNDRNEKNGPPQDRLREWKRMLNSSSSSSWSARAPTVKNQQTGERFFKLAVELMEGDVGASQETVKLLAQDDGLSYIKDLVDRYTQETIDNSAKVRLWLGQIQPLFQLLTHTRVADSNVLEQQVAVICNFIQGIGGRRMKTLFDFIADLLNVWSTLPLAKEDEYGVSACELSLSVLATMIDCNASNIIDDNYKHIVKRFGDHVETTEHSPNNFSKLQARKHLQYLCRRLGVGDALNEAGVGKKAPVTRAEFVMSSDLPGVLSKDGPRHDNDHADICKIRILPTHEEITSKRNEYLPTTDPTQFHEPGIRGRLDREFRLLREDTVGQLRDAVGLQLDAMRDHGRKKDRGNRSNLRTYAYEGATIVDVDFDRNNGMDMVVQFYQPITKKTAHQRREWWGNSRRLQPGGLVCIIAENGTVMFCVVADSTIIAHEQKKEKKDNRPQDETEEPSERPSLADDGDFAYVHLRLAEIRQNDIRQALHWFQSVSHKQRRCLVEFPGILLPSFQHTLMALQRMSKKSDVPFDDLLASDEQSLDVQEVDPPQYTTRAGFSFNLCCLTNDNTVLHHSPQQPLDPEELSQHSTLDLTQSSALLHSLSRKIALIQGPPGTGKSYTGEKLIKALLANKNKAKLGPILCVCYTNHALDQLLVHLQREKVKIIRIGSRSKAEELENVNLRIVAQSSDRTRAERGSLYDLRSILDEHVGSIKESTKKLAACQTWTSIRQYLQDTHRGHYLALFGGVDEDGFETVHHNRGQLLDQWRRSGVEGNPQTRDIDTLQKSDLWSMTHLERSLLYAYWVRQQRNPLIANIMHKYKEYETVKSERDKVSRDVDLRCLHDAEVVGVTTTGLARNLDLLQKLRCKVMLCEEAGEVLEAHTLTALLPFVEHAILIGDHLQLRPQIANYDLQSTNPGGARYSLDVSLFERLINPLHHTDPKLPFDTLETQRRMHPSVSELIRSTLYPSLDDGGSVTGYPEIYGMKKRLFWLHHEIPEDQESQQDPITTSRTNTFEVEMTVSLVQHLVRQGSYGPDDIAVITPYLGQLMQLRREMGRLFEISVGERDMDEIEAAEADKVASEVETAAGYKPPPVKRTLLKSIRLATVDNFQGEEAKVVVISLVRSNDANRCGFLSTSNRINVLLSRAQHGMYLIGNANTYRNVDMWSKVLEILERNKNLGRELELQCPRHPNTPLMVSKADDFLRVAPEGGCILPCDRRLLCGHSCVNRCHHENLHNAVKCLESCPRPKKGCQHPCKLVCGDPCEPRCNEYLRNLNIVLACGHTVSSAFCWEAQDPSVIVCKQRVKKTVPGCGHTVEVPCHTDVNSDSYKCGTMCGDHLPCGHNCRSYCHQCKERKDGKVSRVVHPICRQPCGRKFTACRHNCRQPCHPGSECILCPAPCEVRCSHSKCSKKCHEPCTPCAEQTCASKCPHSQCTMPCAAPCDWVPCSKRCEKIMACGHQCPSVCGETCPDVRFCQICCSEDVKAIQVDFIMGEQYSEINLDEDPCIFPDCGHFTTMTNMDGIMDIKVHYGMSIEGNPTALKKATQPFSMDEVKTCPTCRGSLRNIARYGRIVRRAMLDEATKKFISWSTIEYSRLASRLLDIQEHISKSTPPRILSPKAKPPQLVLVKGRLEQLRALHYWLGGNKYDEALRLWNEIRGFIGLVRKEQQPLQSVDNFVQHAARQRKLKGDFVFDERKIQHKGYLQASSLSLKCDVIIISDFMEVRKGLLQLRPKLTKVDFSPQIKDCKILAAQAKETRHPRQEAEAYIYLAQFHTFTRAFASADDPSSKATPDAKAEELKKEALDNLAAARELVEKYSGQTQGLMAEIEAAEKTLSNGVFYNDVSADEMRAVYAAMAKEFSGTGHWYTCVNGHPFTVGECGLPMQQTKCPECGEAVGGTYHNPAQGVQHANDIDDIARGLGQMGIN